MAARIYENRLISAGPGLPLKEQIAFASIDANGSPGALNTWVLKRLGLDPYSDLPQPTELSEGYCIRTYSDALIVFVVTISSGESTNTLLTENLTKALRALDEQNPANRMLWIPLMGTGAGRLSADQSLDATIDALKESEILSSGQRFWLHFSFDPRMAQEQVATLDSTITRKLLPYIRTRSEDDEGVVGPPPLDAEPAPFHADLPAIRDALDRRGIADALVTIIREVHAELPVEAGSETTRPLSIRTAVPDLVEFIESRWPFGDRPQSRDDKSAAALALNVGRTFVVHIHGPWGSGKSSILNFMRRSLTEPAAGPRWVVIDFNAWRQQDAGPPWWTLLTQVFAQAVTQLDRGDRMRLWASEAWWRFRSGWGPYILALAILLWVVALIFSGKGSGNTFADGLKVVAAVFTLWVGISAFGKSTRLGPARTASMLSELSNDPQMLLSSRFRAVVRQIRRPVAVFIDDLDRCDGPYVVGLMQCLLTLYRDSPVIYVIAADRNWIRASYEKAYENYKDSIGEPGRPLGHLFLEKIFQLSVSVPQLSSAVQSAYWDALLRDDAGSDDEASDDLQLEADQALETAQSDEEARRKVEQEADPARRHAFALAAFRRLQDRDLRSQREHFLKRYANWMEPNPRSMKRLLNAYGFKVGYELLSGLNTDADVLVRWTVVEMRWPTLAEDLALHPEHVVRFRDVGSDVIDNSDLVPLYLSPQVREIVEPLTPDLIRSLTSGESGGMTAAAATV